MTRAVDQPGHADAATTGIGTGGFRRPDPAPLRGPIGLRINVGRSERIAAGAAGAAMMLFAAKRRSMFALALGSVGGALMLRGVSGHCPAYAALGVNTARRPGGAFPEEYFADGLHVEQNITIRRPRHELYSYWRELTNLPRIMRHLKRVDVLDARRSHWVANGPLGLAVEWDAEIINDEPGALIAWRSLERASVDSAGSVNFADAPGNRGTELRIVLDYIPPAGRVGAAVARLLGRDPERQIAEDLRHFKRTMEKGEMPASQAQTRGAPM